MTAVVENVWCDVIRLLSWLFWTGFLLSVLDRMRNRDVDPKLYIDRVANVPGTAR